MSPSIKLPSLLAVTVCALVLVAKSAQTADAPGKQADYQPRPLKAVIYNAETSGWQKMQRVAVSSGTNEFDFVAPYGLRMTASADRLTLVSSNSTYFLAIRILDSVTAELNGGNTDFPREFLLGQFPGAHIIEEFAKTAASRNGPAFELRARAAGGAEQTVWVAFIPSAAGVLEFSCMAQLSKTSEAKTAFNSLLRTFRSNQFGKLESLPTGPDNS